MHAIALTYEHTLLDTKLRSLRTYTSMHAIALTYAHNRLGKQSPSLAYAHYNARHSIALAQFDPLLCTYTGSPDRWLVCA